MSIEFEVQRPFYSLFTPEITAQSVESVTESKLRKSIKLGAEWIANMQEESGRFNYWFDPSTGDYSIKTDDNFLRQAGTCFSLITAADFLDDSVLLNVAKKSLVYLDSFRRDKGPDSSYYLFERKAKLGGIALPMLAMLELKKISGDTSNDVKLKSLANMILYLQDQYGTGQYKSTYVYRGDFEYEKTRNWESDIYPGEAMLALAGMYVAFKDPKYLKSLDAAFNYYSAGGNWKAYPFIPWTVSAFTMLYLETHDQKYATFVFKMIERMLYRQNLDPEDGVFYGSFDGLPTVFTSTSMEALGDAIRLADALEDKEKSKRYRSRALIAYKWLIHLQYSELDVKNGQPQASLGGFKTSLVEPKVRIDNTQHAISALMKGVKFTLN
ncbi:MAG: hypothetical protein RJQ09_01440 [Cyclobacteriaceae bacterium]